MRRCRLVAWVSLLALGACGHVDSNPSRPPIANAAAGAGAQPPQGATAGAAAQPVTGGASSGGSSAATTTGGSAAASPAGGNAATSTTGGSAGSTSNASAGSAGEALGGAGGASDVDVDVNVDAGNEGILQLPLLAGPHPYRAIQIVAGRYHSCALLEDHRVKCWGSNGYGQLGQGDTLDRGLDPAKMGDALPTIDLGTGRTALSIAAGRYSTCALLDDHSAKCWGLSVLHAPVDNVGDKPGEMGDALAPLELNGHQAKALGLGHYDACVALDDDSFFCGGTGQFGSVPAPSDGAHVRKMGHDTRALGLYDDGSVRYIRSGLLEPAMSELAKGDPVLLVAGSLTDHCVYRQSHQLSCLAKHSGLPLQLPGARSLGLTESLVLCATLDSGELHCWRSRLDLPFTEQVDAGELRAKLPAAAYAISTSGDDFQCALLVDGRVVCWDWFGAGAGSGSGAAAVGWNDSGATALQAVDLGMYPGL